MEYFDGHGGNPILNQDHKFSTFCRKALCYLALKIMMHFKKRKTMSKHFNKTFYKMDDLIRSQEGKKVNQKLFKK